MNSPSIVALALALAVPTALGANADGFDVLAGIMDTSKSEINARQAIQSSKQGFQDSHHVKKYREGHWQFFQAKSAAKPGEFCSALFLREGKGVAILGPGGSYKGALLMLFNTHDKAGFPAAAQPRPIAVTLTQGAGAPVNTRALNYKVGSWETPVVVFAVPTVDAALAGMEDRLAFHLQHEGKTLVNVEWHSGIRARGEIRKCLSGEPFGKE
ncbi:hypothetical protein [Caldimonas sp.]|uniref:hypothetical protein n=1 Tax=Caldimonas sp. TaxID=2838790 RepID=UPI00391897E0